MRSAVVPQHSSRRLVQFIGTRDQRNDSPPIAPPPSLVSEQTTSTESVESLLTTTPLAVTAQPIAQLVPIKWMLLTPDKPGYAYVQWDIAAVHRQALKNQGGKHLMLRIQDVTSFDQLDDIPLSVQTYICAEADREKYVAIPVPDHDYIAELGYFTEDYRWLSLHQSDVVRIPAIVN